AARHVLSHDRRAAGLHAGPGRRRHSAARHGSRRGARPAPHPPPRSRLCRDPCAGRVADVRACPPERDADAPALREPVTGTMYLDFYGFREQPFSPTPDPRFLYLTPAHREALAQLLYGVQQSKGFLVLTGEVGTGKTTLLHALLERLPKQTAVAF